jgi:hypothetical protein
MTDETKTRLLKDKWKVEIAEKVVCLNTDEEMEELNQDVCKLIMQDFENTLAQYIASQIDKEIMERL